MKNKTIAIGYKLSCYNKEKQNQGPKHGRNLFLSNIIGKKPAEACK